ncbi:hypothetical protein Hsc_3798 [Herbaspirillum seropedicae]|nr:hypothetical protein Hsc_3798 [Herbaspirillum seropedicae]
MPFSPGYCLACGAPLMSQYFLMRSAEVRERGTFFPVRFAGGHHIRLARRMVARAGHPAPSNIYRRFMAAARLLSRAGRAVARSGALA